jgi:glycerol-3-phosphate cytidylyltransferase-like family protein
MSIDRNQIIQTIIAQLLVKLKQYIDDNMANIKDIIDNIKLQKGERGEDGKDGTNGRDGKDGDNYVLTSKDKKEIAKSIEVPVVEKVIERTEVIKELPMVTEVIEKIDETATVEKIERDIPKLGERIRDGLELLQDEDRLDASAIKNLEKIIRKIIGEQKPIYVGGSSTGGHIVKTYDFSDSLNGVTKTFSLPAFWRIIDVQIGTIPPLRPTIDYTSDASAMTITFTSQVEASTYLAAGLSAIVIYSE